MKKASLIACRELNASLKFNERMTAQEMAIIPHTLSCDAGIARLPDGRCYVWIPSREVWIRYY